MPTFEAEIEFEVFCGTCNAGLCNQSDTRHSKMRGALQLTVEACANCIDNARREGMEVTEAEAQKTIDELESRITELEKSLEQIEEHA